MKILFISPRPFGLMGTPGTYHLVDAYSRHAKVCAIASSKKDSNVDIVHAPSPELELHEVPFGNKGYTKEIADIAEQFNPDIVCIGNYHHWHEVIAQVKKQVPNAKYVLDIKSPLITEENSARRIQIQSAGSENAHLLDLVLTRCVEDIYSWIPDCTRPIHIYPLGVKITQFFPRPITDDVVRCKRFVFIGSYSKNRKLKNMLQFVADLPEEIKNGIVLDMFGSGPEKDELLDFVSKNDLTNIVNIYDSLPQNKLLSLLAEYDAGIGWVPREIYDAAPSLKVLEYLGSGLVPVISATIGHKRNIEDGFNAILFEEDSRSFAEAIEKVHVTGYPREKIEHNLNRITERDWDQVVTQHLLPAYEKLLHGEGIQYLAPIASGSRKDGPEKPSSAAKNKNHPRILMISPRPFGLMGTPGTYHLAEAYARHTDVCVIANKQTTQTVDIVYKNTIGLELHHIPFQTRRYLREITNIAKKFSPDVVWIGNFNLWGEIVAHLKNELKSAKFVLDIKSPLLTGDDHKRRKEIQEAGVQHSSLLDMAIALSAEDVQSWIPGYAKPVKIYPLGVKVDQFSPKAIDAPVVFCRRFVYIGSYQAGRKLDVLIDYFAKLPHRLRDKVTLDMYGSGPEKARLEEIVAGYKLRQRIKIHDALDQDELFKLLPEYDAGISWVPRELYDNAPPLKTLEFIGSGLVPIATDTTAHNRYAAEGFELVSFSENPQSFFEAIEAVCSRGFSKEKLLRNRQLLAQRDMDVLVQEYHFPAYEEVLKQRTIPAPVASSALDDNASSIPPVESALLMPLSKKIDTLDDALNRMQLWAPNIELPKRPLPAPSELRIACILSDRLFDGLSDEAHLLLLQPDSWHETLHYGQADFLLIESTWFTCTGDWYMAQSSSGPQQDKLKSIVDLAKKLGIPTVFWMTLDSQYLPLYRDFSQNFDCVFCADVRAVEELQRNGMQASLLEPAVQPRRFNPIRPLSGNAELTPGIVYDGWGDLFRCSENQDVLKQLASRKLSVIDTSCMMAKMQIDRLQEASIRSSIRGWTPRQYLPEIYKRADAYISFSKTSATPMRAAWAMLEAAACRTPVVHLGEIPDDDFRRNFARISADQNAFLEELAYMENNALERDKIAHLSWREAHANHTYSHRLKKICEALGIQYHWDALPKATLVTGTMRPNLLDKCIKQYLDQTYPNKELILIFNGAPSEVEHLKSAYSSRKDILISTIPSDHYAGSLLNFGTMHATGEYFFRVDDDDHYGENYILDSMLHLKAIDADIFGKRASFFHFEDENEIYLRKKHLPDIAAFSAAQLHASDKTLISGCSFACKTELLKSIRYPDNVNLSADTELIAKIKHAHPASSCLIVDNLNLVVERFADVTKHTWQQNSSAIKNHSTVIGSGISDVMI